MSSPTTRFHYWAQTIRRWWITKAQVALITILTALSVSLYPRTIGRVITGGQERDGAELARLSNQVSLHASGRGNPAINLSNGREVLTAYVGSPELQEALEQNKAQPLSLLPQTSTKTVCLI